MLRVRMMRAASARCCCCISAPHAHSPSSRACWGRVTAWRTLRRELLRVANLDTPVLLRGETGTGKERIARAIHTHSKRASGDYIAVNIATVPETVAISALFGHAKGAFTGAQQRHRGLFERADGGTLLLSGIGETPENVQPMLLRAIETGRRSCRSATSWSAQSMRASWLQPTPIWSVSCAAARSARRSCTGSPATESTRRRCARAAKTFQCC